MQSTQNVIVCFLLLWILPAETANNTSRIPGHKRPFGSHMKPMGVTVIGKFSSPSVFFGHFVRNKLPIHMKSALTESKHPGLEEGQWTDSFFRNYFGVNLVRVEVGKKEVRGRKARWMRFNEFLDAYPHSDLYMVHSISGAMTSLVYVPVTLQCGGFQRTLQEAVLWMGKGPLSSVLHNDELDNLLCVFDGTKELVLIDQFYKDKVEAKGFDHEGHYSRVNMDSVDMHTFPQFENLPWYKVFMEAGDCVYIPNRWYHHVTTYGDRSLALNIWFSHLWRFDDDECSRLDSTTPLKSLDEMGFASPNEALRSRWLAAFEGTDDDVDVDSFKARVTSGSEDNKGEVFGLVDQDRDGLLSWDELYTFDVSHALLLYPDVFQDSRQAQSLLEQPPLPPTTVHEETIEVIVAEPNHSQGAKKSKESDSQECSASAKAEGKCDSEATIGRNHEKTKWTSSDQKIVDHEEL